MLHPVLCAEDVVVMQPQLREHVNTFVAGSCVFTKTRLLLVAAAAAVVPSMIQHGRFWGWLCYQLPFAKQANKPTIQLINKPTNQPASHPANERTTELTN